MAKRAAVNWTVVTKPGQMWKLAIKPKWSDCACHSVKNESESSYARRVKKCEGVTFA